MYSKDTVVSYSISTSNHNRLQERTAIKPLYLIPFLHQTTTLERQQITEMSCILFHFYIKPQLAALQKEQASRCILFHFYIKPQPRPRVLSFSVCCILFHFYIKPQPMAHKALFSSTLSPKSHSHFQRNAVV